ncbi:hypothetical protein [Nonomuraea harbinensis]|uniref:Uncharacterized protein n=1 Tax=Nonomuraea harbinensis TaxID=1286938 RepID=A0ABW1C9X1_9ACTN|nr:hypothetical protein [Nonomuraea harbinensis]
MISASMRLRTAATRRRAATSTVMLTVMATARNTSRAMTLSRPATWKA